MVKRKKKEPQAKIITNQGLPKMEEPEEFDSPELEKEEVKAIRRYIG